jgi:hypothetical protein
MKDRIEAFLADLDRTLAPSAQGKTLEIYHAWGIIHCSHGHRECWMSIYSTPKNPESHARDIQRTVDRCPGPESE